MVLDDVNIAQYIVYSILPGLIYQYRTLGLCLCSECEFISCFEWTFFQSTWTYLHKHFEYIVLCTFDYSLTQITSIKKCAIKSWKQKYHLKNMCMHVWIINSRRECSHTHVLQPFLPWNIHLSLTPYHMPGLYLSLLTLLLGYHIEVQSAHS